MVTTTPVNDAELIRESLRNPDVFSELFDRHSGTIYRHVSRRLGPETAEDIVGDTFLIAFKKRAKYDGAYQDARPWLFGIATKLVARHHRDEAARYRAWKRSAPAALTETAADDQIAAGLTARAAHLKLTAALAELSAGDRDVLLLIAWAELSYEETARALNIPVGTVRSRLNRARRKTRAVLGANPLDEE
jgi:RNA polymerase sigma-70 factor (ECF subfamily)